MGLQELRGKCGAEPWLLAGVTATHRSLQEYGCRGALGTYSHMYHVPQSPLEGQAGPQPPSDLCPGWGPLQGSLLELGHMLTSRFSHLWVWQHQVQAPALTMHVGPGLSACVSGPGLGLQT